MSGFGIYINIPFCDRICIYCDFCVTTRRKQIPEYFDALRNEIAHPDYCYKYSMPDTVYFGGGTPSVLKPAELKNILSLIFSLYRVNPQAEITIEANPNHLNRDIIREYRDMGINRISIGIQSFSNAELKFLTRMHDSQTSFDTMTLMRNEKFPNVNIDLIFGLPGQTTEDWMNNLRSAAGFAPEHISVYNLTVEPGTYLYRFAESKRPDFPDDEVQLEMFTAANDFLTSRGYRHYEISNYARPGFESKHNRSYWEGKPYFGVGAGAHSYDGKTRRWNTRNIDQYIKRLNNENSLPSEGSEDLGLLEKAEEMILLGLRTDSGVSAEAFEDLTGIDFTETFSKTIEPLNGFIIHGDPAAVRLNTQGFFLYNSICEKFIAAIREKIKP